MIKADNTTETNLIEILRMYEDYIDNETSNEDLLQEIQDKFIIIKKE